MRVIAGEARRILLDTPSGLLTRPTSDKVKETLFNIINFDLYDADFLDLFSGSGGIGIEALSRGAKFCTFIENNKEALNCINSNLKRTKFLEKSKVLNFDFLLALDILEKDKKSFDIIFLDPPYNKGLENRVLSYLEKSSLYKENSVIIVEMSNESNENTLESDIFKIDKIKKYKNNKHIFLKVR